MERRGIVSASITLLPEITRRVGVSRALELPYPLGLPLGEANAPKLQRAVLRSLLDLVLRDDVPVIEAFG